MLFFPNNVWSLILKIKIIFFVLSCGLLQLVAPFSFTYLYSILLNIFQSCCVSLFQNLALEYFIVINLLFLFFSSYIFSVTKTKCQSIFICLKCWSVFSMCSFMKSHGPVRSAFTS